MKRHMDQYPATHSEDLESHETGASLVEAFHKCKDGFGLTETLNQLGLGSTREAAKINRSEKYVDLERRQSYHREAQRRKRAHKAYKKMMAQRSRLPAYSHENEIVTTVLQHPVTIVQGETGALRNILRVFCSEQGRSKTFAFAHRMWKEYPSSTVFVGCESKG